MFFKKILQDDIYYTEKSCLHACEHDWPRKNIVYIHKTLNYINLFRAPDIDVKYESTKKKTR
jgi:hypothetical protein